MNLTLHLVRTDLRRFRLAVLFCAAIVGAQGLLVHRILALEYGDWRMIACGFVIVLQLLGMFVSYVLSGFIVLADAPASSVAYWQTRPISGGRLLAAKALVVVLVFGAMPVVLWLPWWLGWSFGAAGTAQAAANVFLAGLLPSVLGAALAAVSDQIGRFMMLTAILLAGIAVFALTSMVPPLAPAGLFGTRLLLGLAGLVGAALVALVVQYRTRQIRLAAAVLVTGLVLLLAIRAWWPLDLEPWWRTSHASYDGAQSITASVEQGARIGKGSAADSQEPYRLVLFVNFENVPDEVFPSGGYADVELSWPDGARVRRENVRFMERPDGIVGSPLRQALGFPRQDFWVRPKHWDPETEEWSERARARWNSRQLRPGLRRPTVPDAGRAAAIEYNLRCDVPLSVDEAAKVRAQAPACRILARVAMMRPAVLAESPVRPGTTLVRDGRGELLRLERKEFPVRDHERPGSRYAGTISVIQPPGGPRRTFVLVDREHQTIGHAFSNAHMGMPPMAAAVVAYPVLFSPPTLWRSDRWVEMPRWMETFTLVELEPQPAGIFGWSGGVDRLTIAATEGPE